MTSLLIKIFLKDKDPSGDGRHAYGRLAGATGLAANIMLFLAKLFAGILTGSIAITADAINNLSDAASSVLTLIGFKLSAAPPDEEHPFGHGRMEYILAMAIATLVLFAGVELAKSSVSKIINPVVVSFGAVSTIILVVSILVKLWMAFFYTKIGKMIDSTALESAAIDSRNDVLGTAVVLISSIITLIFDIQIDGYIGTAVALFIILSGFSMIKETASILVGEAPDPELVADIKQTALSHSGIYGIHDLIVHNYGPQQYIISFHAEVSADVDMLTSHDVIDKLEMEMNEKYNAATCIHMDPIELDNPLVSKLKELTEQELKKINDSYSLHDFRVIFGKSNTNLIFDLVIPRKHMSKKKKSKLVSQLQERVQSHNDKIKIIATVEHSYV